MNQHISLSSELHGTKSGKEKTKMIKINYVFNLFNKNIFDI